MMNDDDSEAMEAVRKGCPVCPPTALHEGGSLECPREAEHQQLERAAREYARSRLGGPPGIDDDLWHPGDVWDELLRAWLAGIAERQPVEEPDR